MKTIIKAMCVVGMAGVIVAAGLLLGIRRATRHLWLTRPQQVTLQMGANERSFKPTAYRAPRSHRSVRFVTLGVEVMKEAGQIKAGCRPPSRTYEISPPEISMVRKRLKVSQDEFAVMIGVSTRTLQNWEQGRRRPEGPAKALLTIASRNPAAVLDALHGEKTGPTTKSTRSPPCVSRVSNA